MNSLPPRQAFSLQLGTARPSAQTSPRLSCPWSLAYGKATVVMVWRVGFLVRCLNTWNSTYQKLFLRSPTAIVPSVWSYWNIEMSYTLCQLQVFMPSCNGHPFFTLWVSTTSQPIYFVPTSLAVSGFFADISSPQIHNIGHLQTSGLGFFSRLYLDSPEMRCHPFSMVETTGYLVIVLLLSPLLTIRYL